MAVNDATPNNPKNPATTAVNRLIGICSPIAPPNTLTKNKNRMPIPSLMVACPINRIGLIGAPTSKRITINPTIMLITSVEFTNNQPLFFFRFFIYPYLLFMTKRGRKEPNLIRDGTLLEHSCSIANDFIREKFCCFIT